MATIVGLASDNVARVELIVGTTEIAVPIVKNSFYYEFEALRNERTGMLLRFTYQDGDVRLSRVPGPPSQ